MYFFFWSAPFFFWLHLSHDFCISHLKLGDAQSCEFRHPLTSMFDPLYRQFQQYSFSNADLFSVRNFHHWSLITTRVGEWGGRGGGAAVLMPLSRPGRVPLRVQHTLQWRCGETIPKLAFAYLRWTFLQNVLFCGEMEAQNILSSPHCSTTQPPFLCQQKDLIQYN